jgi:hypothetical protein
MDILQSGQFVELRNAPYGENNYRATKKDDREYKDVVMLFFIPSNHGDQQEVLQWFKKFLHQVFSSSHFFVLMESFTQTLPYEGGQIGKHLHNKDSDSWQILKDVLNYSLSKIESLDTELLDKDIYKTLNKMFPNNSYLEGFQKFGWRDKLSTPFEKSKKLSTPFEKSKNIWVIFETYEISVVLHEIYIILVP